MSVKNLQCPNCGAKVKKNQEKCEYCGAFLHFNDEQNATVNSNVTNENVNNNTPNAVVPTTHQSKKIFNANIIKDIIFMVIGLLFVLIPLIPLFEILDEDDLFEDEFPILFIVLLIFIIIGICLLISGIVSIIKNIKKQKNDK